MGFFDFLDADKRREKREKKEAAELDRCLEVFLMDTRDSKGHVSDIVLLYVQANSPEKSHALADSVRERALAVLTDDDLATPEKEERFNTIAGRVVSLYAKLMVSMGGIEGVMADPDVFERTQDRGECWRELAEDLSAHGKRAFASAEDSVPGDTGATSITALDCYSDQADDRSFPLIQGLSKEAALAKYPDFHIAYANHAYSEGSARGFRDADRELIELGLEKALMKSGLLFLLSAHHLFNKRMVEAFVSAVQAFHASRVPPSGAGSHVYAYYLLYYLFEAKGSATDPPIHELIAMNNPGIDIRCADDTYVRDFVVSHASVLSPELLAEAQKLLRGCLEPRQGATPFPKCW